MDGFALALLVLIFLMSIPTLALVAVIYSRLFTQSPIAPLLGAPRGLNAASATASTVAKPKELVTDPTETTEIVEIIPPEYSGDNVVNSVDSPSAANQFFDEEDKSIQTFFNQTMNFSGAYMTSLLGGNGVGLVSGPLTAPQDNYLWSYDGNYITNSSSKTCLSVQSDGTVQLGQCGVGRWVWRQDVNTNNPSVGTFTYWASSDATPQQLVSDNGTLTTVQVPNPDALVTVG
jgi:hypothetical protein